MLFLRNLLILVIVATCAGTAREITRIARVLLG